MDQVKEFLRQCVKYRFWIAFGVSLLLPMIGYLVGSGAYSEATTKQEGAIKSAKNDIQKYQSSTPPNADYKKLVDDKKAILTTDVEATWRKLYALQEPLLKWPDVVEDKFRKWGRKWPENVDQGQVRQAITDYTFAYPEFVSRVYQTFNPWNPEDGTGIVLGPDMTTLLKPAAFSSDNPPELTKVWAEQERLWVLTALLDAIAKINGPAKEWETATIKQILALEVGSALAQDQKSMAKGDTLEPAPPLLPPGAPPPPPPAVGTGLTPPGGGPGGNSNQGGEVLYFKANGQQPYKILPIMMKVLVDQDKLPEFLVGLENSPMAIQVMEPEISKPSIPVVKPVYGETMMGGMGSGFGGGGGRGGTVMPGGDGGRMPSAANNNRGGGTVMPNPGAGGNRPGGGESMGFGPSMGRGGMNKPGGGSGAGAAATKGTDQRGIDKAAERRKKEAASKATKAAPKKNFDQYYNVIEVTVYGQARFYNTPPAPPATEASKAPEPAKPEPAAPPTPAKPETPAPGADASKNETPKPTPTPQPDAPKAESPKPDAPGVPAPKADASKTDSPRPEPPANKADGPTPKP